MQFVRRAIVVVVLIASLALPALVAGQTTPRVVSGTVTATNYSGLAAGARMVATLYENPQGGARRAVVTLTTPNISNAAPPYSYQPSSTTALNVGSTQDLDIALA